MSSVNRGRIEVHMQVRVVKKEVCMCIHAGIHVVYNRVLCAYYMYTYMDMNVLGIP